MQVKTYNREGNETGTIELPDKIFGVKWNPALVHQVATSLAANLRRPVAHAKGRGEVRGGGKKPWRQKGTGRARHGSIRSPIWRGGGAAHGPKSEKVFAKKINKKMARAALRSTLSAQAKEGRLVVVDNLDFPEQKTKYAAHAFRALSTNFPALMKQNGVLLALKGTDSVAKIAARNLPYVETIEARNLNVYEVLQHTYLVATKTAVDILIKRL